MGFGKILNDLKKSVGAGYCRLLCVCFLFDIGTCGCLTWHKDENKKYSEYYRLGQKKWKRATVTSPAPFWIVERFSTQRAKSDKKVLGEKDTGHNLSSGGCLMLQTLVPHWKKLREDSGKNVIWTQTLSCFFNHYQTTTKEEEEDTIK